MSNDYLYHTTYLFHGPPIEENGLIPSSGGQFAGHQARSGGKVFLSDAKGVSFWMSKLEAMAEHNSDFNQEEDIGWTLIVLRVEREALEDEEIETHPDKAGSQDSYSEAVYVTKPLAPDLLEVWDGTQWVNLEDGVEWGRMDDEAEAAAEWESDDDDDDDDDDWSEPTGWWVLNFDLFEPPRPVR